MEEKATYDFLKPNTKYAYVLKVVKTITINADSKAQALENYRNGVYFQEHDDSVEIVGKLTNKE